MKSLAEFLTMGGYGAYVWSAYGICAAILIGNLWQARHQARLTVHRIKRRLRQRNEIP